MNLRSLFLININSLHVIVIIRGFARSLFRMFFPVSLVRFSRNTSFLYIFGLYNSAYESIMPQKQN